MKEIIKKLNIHLYADGADIKNINNFLNLGFIKGFTTNPSLMRKAGVKDYKTFALDFLNQVKNLPISFEVFADDLPQMEKQAREIASWGDNVIIKIPITNTKSISTKNIIKNLSDDGISLNITAIFTLEQIEEILNYINKNSFTILSIFAGRIADTSINPEDVIIKAVKKVEDCKNIKILWASPRELLNIFQAENCGCHIITIAPDIISKLNLIQKDLNEFSLDTVKMFYDDAKKAGYKI